MREITRDLSIFHYVKSVRFHSFLVRMQGNTDQKNTEYGHFSRSTWEENIVINSYY